MFVTNPDSFLLPAFRISPFKTEHIAENHFLKQDDFSAKYFDEKFGKGKWTLTINGREAIKLALQNYSLQKNDIVTILTTSQNFYISSCVTKEIENVCLWNREIVPETKVIFVNHEFGYPYPEMESLKKLGLPIIEDCCTTFFSQDKNNLMGFYGDYSVYSFPKFFPIQIGGILVDHKNQTKNISSKITDLEKDYIQKVISFHLKNENELVNKRKENFEYALSIFSKLGFTERFQKNDKMVPSCLLLNNHGIIKDLNALKIYLSQNGIQSSVFYGEDAFFIPNHQNMNTTEIDFIFEVISIFQKNYNG